MSTWKVPVIAQTTIEICWEACGRMLWQWKFHNLAGYPGKAGKYATLKKGLTQAEMDVYYQQLGLRMLKPAKATNLRFALSWTPVIFTSIHQKTGHAMVAAGFDTTKSKYSIVNPCAVEEVDFSSSSGDSCKAGLVELPAGDVDAPLGTYIWYW
jgi:hypothetical protein